MSNHTSGGPTPLAAEVVDRLLDLLSSDDEFRALFLHDPAVALIQAGHVADEDGLATLRQQLAVQVLAPKSVIAAAREEIRASLTCGMAMHPIQLDAGPGTDPGAH